MPLLHVDTVVDAIVDVLDSGFSQTVFLPGIFRFFAGLVSYFPSRIAEFLLIAHSGVRRIGFRTLSVAVLNL